MQRKPVHHEELEPEYLDIVAGGRTQVLQRKFHGSKNIDEVSHYFETLSDPIPGATLAEANALVNRYNAPTTSAMIGNGNDPHAAHGVVDIPYTGLPFGSITMTRGESDGHAWVKNTADPLHPFIGTTTRTVVDSPEGYRILTVGEGHGAGDISAGTLGTNARHWANYEAGPWAFQQLDDNMLKHWHKPEPEPAHDAQPHADPAREQPQSGANAPASE
jgi:hypothetical protein